MTSNIKKYYSKSNIFPKKTKRSPLKITPERNSLDPISHSSSINQMTSLQFEKESEVTSKNLEKRSDKVRVFLESKKVTITMSIVTVYALFADDIKTLGFSKSADNIFSSFVVICLVLFTFELAISFKYKDNYKWSFFFWLDLIAALSLITDIGWIWDELIGVSNSNNSSRQLQNAAKASRAGTRTSRILRIIRLIRLIRLVKLYKHAKIALKNGEEDEEDLQNELENITQESKVGKKLSEVTMKRVIFIVLIMLFVLPVLEGEFYLNSLTSWVFGIYEMETHLNKFSFDIALKRYISYHKNDIRPLIYLSYKNNTGNYEWTHGIDYNDLRYTEIFYFSYQDFIAIFDTRYDSRLTSLLNIFKTIFICIVLTFGAVYFTKDAEDLVIKPIEKIIEKLKKIAKNPLAASEIKSIREQLIEISSKKKCFCFKAQKEEAKVDYETRIIEDTIIKIGVLLALGFGEAGSAIIGSNVERNTGIDSMLTGVKIVGIFGFCDIRNFTDTTEELQEGVMMFVNEIAQIIHGIVDKYFGAANKNIGDAFLIVWKFSSEEFFVSEDLIVRNPESKRAFYVPDLALLSFLKVQAKINKDPIVLKYRNNQKLTQRMPGYEVKMGFGLHLGWAIEGAIGSYFKVDASYLSPHVYLSSFLENLTKLYGVPLLISENLFEMFSCSVKKLCRRVDNVKLKCIPSPFGLFTSDLDFTHFNSGKVVGRKKEMYRRKRSLLKRKLESGEITAGALFERSKEVQLMRKEIDSKFLQVFGEGLELYLEGDWEAAKQKLQECLKVKVNDGPTRAILQFMGEFGFCVPENWQHCRNI